MSYFGITAVTNHHASLIFCAQTNVAKIIARIIIYKVSLIIYSLLFVLNLEHLQLIVLVIVFDFTYFGFAARARVFILSSPLFNALEAVVMSAVSNQSLFRFLNVVGANSTNFSNFISLSRWIFRSN